MNVEQHLAQVAEKYRAPVQELHEFVCCRIGSHSVSLRPGGIVSYGVGADGFMLVGLAVRSAGVMLYASADVLTDHADELGKKRTGKTCVRLRKISDVKQVILDDIVQRSLAKQQMSYG